MILKHGKIIKFWIYISFKRKLL